MLFSFNKNIRFPPIKTGKDKKGQNSYKGGITKKLQN